MSDLTKRLRDRSHRARPFGDDTPALLREAAGTIDSLEAQVKEAEAQRDNDRRAVRSLERVKDENDDLRARITLMEKVVEEADAYVVTRSLESLDRLVIALAALDQKGEQK